MPSNFFGHRAVNLTSDIIAEASRRPLHLQTSRELLALARVSSSSCWRDARWVFDNTTAGAARSQSSVNWNIDLPGGSNLLDPQCADLLDWLRRLVWSAYAAPGNGANGLKSGTLGQVGTGLKYWVRWLSSKHINWPHEIDSNAVADYLDYIQDDGLEDDDTTDLTVAQAYLRLKPMALLWRQRFVLNRVGIAPMPTSPFGRVGVLKIAKKLAAVGWGSYRPLPDEVAIPVINTAMAMLGEPAADVITLSESCANAYAQSSAKTVGRFRQKQLAERRQLAAAKAFKFTEIDGEPWHDPLDPADWDPATVAIAVQKLRTYLQKLTVAPPTSPNGRATLPTYQHESDECIDLRTIALAAGFKPGDEQMLSRHPALHSLIAAAALELVGLSVPRIGTLQRVRQLVLAIRSAAHLVIQSTTGMRISEICGLKAGIDPATGLPSTVQVKDSLNGLSEIFILNSDLAKGQPTPYAMPWVLGYRPKGTTDIPPAVHAIIVLNKLLQPWRELIGTDDLFVGFVSRTGLPKSVSGVGPIFASRLRLSARVFISEWVDLTALPDEAARKTMDKELTLYRDSHGRTIRTHQLRKTFGYFASNIDRRLIPMLQMNFHHVSSAVTDGAYTGNPILERDFNDVRYQRMALDMLEIARGNSGMAGRFGEQLESRIALELGQRIEHLSTDEGYLEAYVYVEEAGLNRLFFEPYGICGALSASKMACHEAGGTADLARWEHRLTPNIDTRHPSLCAGCESFAISRRHLPYWEMRYIDNSAQLRAFEARGLTGWMVDGALAIARAQANQAATICRKLGSDLSQLENLVITEVREALSAA